MMDPSGMTWKTPACATRWRADSTFAAGTAERGVVHVWTVSLACPDADAAWPDLNDLERQRARSFTFDRDRRRFVIARSALRRILGKRLRIAPASLYFEHNTAGKPHLREWPELAFNLSHSEDLAFIVLADSPTAIGIDVETVRAMPDAIELAETVCSREETDAIAADAEPDRAFLRVWTRKEAVSKALGLGVGSIDLRQLDVGFAGELRTSLLGEHVVVVPLDTAGGYVASIAQLARDVPLIKQVSADATLWRSSPVECCDG